MKKLVLLASLMALPLGACGASDILMGIATVGGAAVGAGSQHQATATIDQRLLKASAKRALEADESFTIAAKAGRIPASTDPDTARPNFCKLVTEGLALLDESNAGSKGSELTCWIEYHADRAAAAVDANDPAAYAENVAKLDNFTDQLVALVRAANAGAKP